MCCGLWFVRSGVICFITKTEVELLHFMKWPQKTGNEMKFEMEKKTDPAHFSPNCTDPAHFVLLGKTSDMYS